MAVADIMQVAPGPVHENQQAAALYEEAQQAMAQDDFNKARRKLRQAHQTDPQDMVILDAFGAFLAEAGPQAESITVLQKAVQQQPDTGFEKYMYLGQLLNDAEAIASMRKGIAVLQRHMAQLEGDEKVEGEEQLAGALCALAERLLGSADTVQAVQADCEQLLQQAQQVCSTSPEPQQVLASLRVEQQRPEEALQQLQASMQKWYPALQKAMAQQSDSDSEDADEPLAAINNTEAANGDAEAGHGNAEAVVGSTDAADGNASMSEASEDLDEQLPSFEFRFETAKLLIEIDDTTTAAVQILDSLIAEDDSVPNVWYMLAMCLLGGGEFEAAEEALQQGQLLLKKSADADDLVKEFSELKVAIDAAAQAQAVGPE